MTADLLLSAQPTATLLDRMALDTCDAPIHGVIASLVQLYRQDIRSLLELRDDTLFSRKAPGISQEERLGLLLERAIDLDAKLASL